MSFMHSKPMQFLSGLFSFQGYAWTLITVAVLAILLSGCSTTWEQQVGNHTVTAHWGVDYENDDE